MTHNVPRLAGGGAKIKQELDAVDEKIVELEAKVATESRQAFSNAEWIKIRGKFNQL